MGESNSERKGARKPGRTDASSDSKKSSSLDPRSEDMSRGMYNRLKAKLTSLAQVLTSSKTFEEALKAIEDLDLSFPESEDERDKPYGCGLLGAELGYGKDAVQKPASAAFGPGGVPDIKPVS